MRRRDGITLISVVVTIIILIILAGISINMTMGENGIITVAKRAKQNIELSQIEEQRKLNELYIQLEENGGIGIEYDAIEKLNEFKRKIADYVEEAGGIKPEYIANAEEFGEKIKGIVKEVTKTATATPEDIVKDKTAWVDGRMITGTRVDNTIMYQGPFLWNSGYLYYYGKSTNIAGNWEIMTSGDGVAIEYADYLYFDSTTKGSASFTTSNKIDLSIFENISVNMDLNIPHYAWNVETQISKDKENWTTLTKNSANGSSSSQKYVNANVSASINTAEPVYVRIILTTTGANGKTSAKIYSIGFESSHIAPNTSFLWRAGYIYYYGKDSNNIEDWQMEYNNGGTAKKNTNNLYFSTPQVNSTVSAITKNKIDISKFTQIIVNYEKKIPHYGWSIEFQYSTNKENWTTIIKDSANGTSSSGKYATVNLTQNISIAEPVYIRILLNSTSPNGETSLKVYSINFISNQVIT